MDDDIEMWDDGWRICGKCQDGFTDFEDYNENQENGMIFCDNTECRDNKCMADELLCGECFETLLPKIINKECFKSDRIKTYKKIERIQSSSSNPS